MKSQREIMAALLDGKTLYANDGGELKLNSEGTIVNSNGQPFYGHIDVSYDWKIKQEPRVVWVLVDAHDQPRDAYIDEDSARNIAASHDCFVKKFIEVVE